MPRAEGFVFIDFGMLSPDPFSEHVCNCGLWFLVSLLVHDAKSCSWIDLGGNETLMQKKSWQEF